MKAMLIETHGPVESTPLRLADVPEPEPGAGEVRIRVHACAICRTDLHVIEAELPPHKQPLVPGHQAVGTVERLGPGCNRLQVGQRVGIAWLRHTCGECEYCRSGQENLCAASKYTGYDADGGYAEQAVVAEDFAYEIPQPYDDVHAAPLLCAGIVGFRALERARLPAGGKLGMIGFGSSAHVICQLARHRGATIYVATRGERHRQLALELGAAWAGEHPRDFPCPLDSIILFAPAGELVPPALRALDRGGTLALAGIYLSQIPPLDYERELFYERTLCSVTSNTREDGRTLLQAAAEASIMPEVVRYDLADANRALQDLKADRIRGTGVLEIGS